ncbi:hypothetical protein BSTEL_0712 [Bifidobacterium stellenboschense]|uniref:Uncharacterized protein n=1 Tax=Bifidobacterium stellenboschense TaxID=762211 RepID=A0A087DQV1_9BIFI|nr:hypothetical protein BSTEL_0712 [Bifidobacterium stellenboschense]
MMQYPPSSHEAILIRPRSQRSSLRRDRETRSSFVVMQYPSSSWCHTRHGTFPSTHNQRAKPVHAPAPHSKPNYNPCHAFQSHIPTNRPIAHPIARPVTQPQPSYPTSCTTPGTTRSAVSHRTLACHWHRRDFLLLSHSEANHTLLSHIQYTPRPALFRRVSEPCHTPVDPPHKPASRDALMPTPPDDGPGQRCPIGHRPVIGDCLRKHATGCCPPVAESTVKLFALGWANGKPVSDETPQYNRIARPSSQWSAASVFGCLEWFHGRQLKPVTHFPRRFRLYGRQFKPVTHFPRQSRH